MGCDIHWFVERRDHDGAWHTMASKTYGYEIPDGGRLRSVGGRDYELFALLSGVRGEPLLTP